jgi:23S rRNA (cytidine1920-2'-O)/16S rRNA (cytidine1409-2'-O)-methyltransferase
LAGSRSQAGALIDAGVVLVGGAVAERASRLVDAAESVAVLGPAPRFVGRGGEKLDAALDHFGVDVAAGRVLDAGASTGGFTDCLLQRGAAQVVAVDVGRGQLHDRLRHDGRVVLRERTNIRTASLDALGGTAFDVVVADLSFISLRTVAPQLVSLTRPGGDLVVLVKPQFEAGRSAVSRGRGVIRDPEVWRTTLREVIVALEEAGATMMGVMVSPLQGADGNVEYFAHLRRGSSGAGAGGGDGEIEAAVAQAVAAVSSGSFRGGGPRRPDRPAEPEG